MLKVGAICIVPVKINQISLVRIYLLKVNNRSTGTRCERYLKLTPGVIVVYLLLTLNIFHTFF